MTPAMSAKAPVSATAVTAPLLAIVPTPNAEPRATGIASHHIALLEAAAVDHSYAQLAGTRTVRNFADLPQGMGYLADQAPGLLFALTDVRGEVIWQFRPDVPGVDRGKYQQQAGSGGIINFWPGMAERIPTATTVLIVEGTKQSMAAARWASADLVVLGIQGCSGWSRDGVPNGDLDALVLDKAVVIAFDGDIETNYHVWGQGDRLRRVLEAAGASSVAFIPTVTSAKAGLDDYLVQRSAEPGAGGRTETLSRLVAQATVRMPKRPAKPQVKAGKGKPTVDWARGVICMAQNPDSLDPTKPYEPPPVILGAAVRMRCSTDIQDDLNFGRDKVVVHDLEYAIGAIGTPERFEGLIKGVPDSVFEKDVRKWVEQFDGSRGTHIERAGTTADDGLVVAAIRSAGSSFDRTDYQRTGLVYSPSGDAAWLHAGGAITARGNVDETSSHLNGRLAHIDIPDPAAISPAEAKDLWVQALKIVDYFVDPTIWICTVGAKAIAASGARTAAGLLVVGDPGAGKTTITQYSFAHYSPFNADNAMVSMNSTGGFVAGGGKGAHMCALFVDDAYPRTSLKARETQVETLQQLMRSSYDGESAAKGRMNKDVAGEWVSGTPDQTRFAVVVTAEEIPEGGPAVRSLLERVLTVQVKKGQLIADKSQLAIVDAFAHSGGLQKVFGLYLMDMLQQAEKAALTRGMGAKGVIQASADLANEIRSEAAEWLHKVEPDLDDRGYQVPAAFTAGWAMYVAAAHRAGAITAAKADELTCAGRDRIRAAAVKHSREVLGAHATRGAVMLDALRVAVITEEAYLGSRDDEEARLGNRFRTSATCLGFNVKPRGVPEPCVAIIAEAAMKVTGALSIQAVHAALRNVAVLKDGGITHTQKRNGVNVRVILIPRSVWEADPDAVIVNGAVVVATDGPSDTDAPEPDPGESSPVLTMTSPVVPVAAPLLASGLDYVPDQYGNDPRIEF